MYLRSSFRLLADFYIGSSLVPFQGGVQGNRAAPLIWLILSILLVRYLYSSRWVSVRMSAISKVAYQLAGFLYIDDTDLVALNSGNESEAEVVARA